MNDLVFSEENRWFATYIRCGYCKIGPFDSKEEADLFQTIALAPLATSEQRDSAPVPVAPLGVQWLGSPHYHAGRVWYLTRYENGRITPRDRFIS